MRHRSRFALVGALLGAAAVAISCGEVPTLDGGIAYITPVLLPSPAVAAGDTLRDSLGIATPLRVRAFGRDSQEITGLTVTFLPTALPAPATIGATGYVFVARDTVGSLQIVGRIGDRLQTPPVTLLVVPQPLFIARPADAGLGDSAYVLPALKALPVIVTGLSKGASATVNGIIVRYRVDSLRPATLPPGSAILSNASGVTMRPDSTTATDTTRTAGNATSSVLVLAGSGVQRVYISASAHRLDGPPLQGSPVHFVLDIKPAVSP